MSDTIVVIEFRYISLFFFLFPLIFFFFLLLFR
jgi:hypothetical protein